MITRLSSQFDDDSDSWKGGVRTLRAQAGRLRSAVRRLVCRSRHHLRRQRPAHRSEREQLGGRFDTENLFLKVGTNFGADDAQRLQFTASNFKIKGKGNYHWVEGSRALRIPDTAEPGSPLGTGGISLAGDEFNDFEQYVLRYTHDNLFGGSFAADAYIADQAMRFPADNGADRQDPLIAPIGTLVDRRRSPREEGRSCSWTRPDMFGVAGLELHVGLDFAKDDTDQSLALTNRVWVPPIEYKSIAPYAQLSYDIGPVTVARRRPPRGWRALGERLHDDVLPQSRFRGGRLARLRGGAVQRRRDLARHDDFSAFVSYSEGFTLPNIGIPLRNVNRPGQSVEGILALKAIIFDNKEVGFNWRGSVVSLSGSYYESKSDLGSSLAVDPVTQDFVLVRAPVEIKGYEATAELNVIDNWKFTALYSHTEGHTTLAGAPNGPLNLEMGVTNISPDRLTGSVQWDFLPNGSAALGATSYIGRDINEGRAGEEHTHGYTIFDLTVSYDTERWGAFSLGVENLTDKFYFLSFSQIDFFRNYFAGRGRTVSLNYRIDF